MGTKGVFAMTTGARIRERRKELGIPAEYLAEKLGVSPATVYRYESGAIEKVPGDLLPAISRLLGTTPAHLMGWDEADASAPPPGFLPLPATVRLPLVGQIACGTPITAEQNIEDYVAVPEAAHATFVLLCKGDSMAPHILDGDLVYIRKQPTVETGEVAAVRIGTEATLKRVYTAPGQLILQPDNHDYPPQVYAGAQLEEVTIEGKAVGLYRAM